MASHYASHFSRLRIDHFKDMPVVGSSLLSLRDAKDALEECRQVCDQHTVISPVPPPLPSRILVIIKDKLLVMMKDKLTILEVYW